MKAKAPAPIYFGGVFRIRPLTRMRTVAKIEKLYKNLYSFSKISLFSGIASDILDSGVVGCSLLSEIFASVPRRGRRIGMKKVASGPLFSPYSHGRWSRVAPAVLSTVITIEKVQFPTLHFLNVIQMTWPVLF